MARTETQEMRPVNLADILRPYARKWVALTWEKDKVLASGSTLSEVVAQVKSYPRPVYTFVSDPRYGHLPANG